jgi:predicted membrane channel-forming protein YqfA (hemolysin III family)
VPFTGLPFFTAFLLWDAVSLAALTAALLRVQARLPAFAPARASFSILLGLSFFPVFAALLQGQDVLLLVLLLALTYSALRRNAALTAGCWLGLGLFRFTLVLPLALNLFFISRKPSRLLAGFGLTGALLACASFAIAGWRNAIFYFATVLHWERTFAGPTVPADMPNLRGLIQSSFAAFGLGSSPLVTVAIAAGSLALLAWSVKCSRGANRPEPFDLSFSLALIAAVLMSYHAYMYDLSVLLIAVVLIVNDCVVRRPMSSYWTMAAPIFLLFLTPLHLALWFRAQLACLWAGLLLAWFWMITRELRRGPGSADSRSWRHN